MWRWHREGHRELWEELQESEPMVSPSSKPHRAVPSVEPRFSAPGLGSAVPGTPSEEAEEQREENYPRVLAWLTARLLECIWSQFSHTMRPLGLIAAAPLGAGVG